MNKEKIAIIGSGISGISASLLLSKKYDVYLFEKNNYLGGHTRTKTIKENNLSYNIDTGFIVFNNDNYPDLVDFFDYLNVDTQNSNMSFSISIKNPFLEYGSRGFNSLFSQKTNLYSIDFWLLLKEIIRLYNHCKNISFSEKLQDWTIEDFLNNYKYSNKIKDFHIYPMISSIWSCDKTAVKEFPLVSFINFFNNHNLFNFYNRKQWKFVKGGSYKYIEKIINKKLFKYEINKSVKRIVRNKNDKIKIIFENNEIFFADKIVIATHADQALKMIEKPSEDEKKILSKFKYSKNHAYLHSDISFMPNKKTVWSSWNFQGKNKDEHVFSLTYWMNLLQNLQSQKNYFVTINPYDLPNDIYDQTIFEHPIFNLDTLYAQKNMSKIQGNSNTWFCGSYCGYGFHEDGIQSSVYISKLLGSEILWNRSSHFINRIGFSNYD